MKRGSARVRRESFSSEQSQTNRSSRNSIINPLKRKKTIKVKKKTPFKTKPVDLHTMYELHPDGKRLCYDGKQSR